VFQGLFWGLFMVSFHAASDAVSGHSITAASMLRYILIYLFGGALVGALTYLYNARKD